MSSSLIDSRIEEAPPAATACANGILPDTMQDDDKTNNNGTGEADNSGECVSNRFLHSDENLKECQEVQDDENDDHKGPQAAYQQAPVGSSRSPPQWANRQLHRSVSVDDLMEYQREFRLENVGRASSAYDLTDYLREFRAILAKQQHDCNATTDQDNSNDNINKATKRLIRNSIANSDLAEFKRQFCQERAARTMRRTKSADDATRIKPKDVTAKLNSLKNTTTSMDDYQWGTRSLRRAILGSDLGTFQRSVRTALLESSRENSSSGSVDSAEQTTDCENLEDPISKQACVSSSTSSLGVNHRDSVDLRRHPKLPALLWQEAQQQEEDWGTRSLRKSLKELDLKDPHNNDPTSPPYRPKPMRRIETVHEEELELPLDAPLSSPWQEDKLHSASANGLKMPRRVVSRESADPEDRNDNGSQKQQGSNDNTAKPASSTSQSRSVSLNDIGVLPASPLGGAGASAVSPSEKPEFEWQLRSRFRRSISSSDIEKYQRHFDGNGMDEDDDAGGAGEATDKDGKNDSLDDRSAHTVAVVESIPTTQTNGGADQLHPLLSPAAGQLFTLDDNQNAEHDNHDDASNNSRHARRQQRSPRRRHRRSTSDEPELHMENVIADVAPRKPTRTTSRPISPPPPRSVVVRFADNCTQVVEIPKVSEDMKPYLFYTKRDVKRFRMNEHRRQEEQIRSYMEYLNQKENVLDSSPCIFD